MQHELLTMATDKWTGSVQRFLEKSTEKIHTSSAKNSSISVSRSPAATLSFTHCSTRQALPGMTDRPFRMPHAAI
jgi:hypothetical protein